MNTMVLRIFCGVATIVLTVGAAHAQVTATTIAIGAGYDSGNPNTTTANLTTLGTADWIASAATATQRQFAN